MKVFFFILCLPFFVFESTGSKNKKTFTETITINFKETESYLIKDTIYEDSALRFIDGAFLPLSVSVENENASRNFETSVKRIVQKINRNAQNDTFFLYDGFLRDTSQLLSYSSGEFVLNCYSDKTIFKKFDSPLLWKSLEHKKRFITVHLGNYPVTYTYEIKSEQKLTKKEIEKIRKKLSLYFDEEPDYADLFHCNKKPDERFLFAEPECSFYSAKKCSVQRLVN